MKRFISALALCMSLLVLLSAFLYRGAEAAKENPLVTLLNLPAPPPPNPAVRRVSRYRDPREFARSVPPKDDAPIGEILEYWTSINEAYQRFGYWTKASERSADRLYAEIEKNPKLLTQLLNALPGDKHTADLVKSLYDREGKGGAFAREDRSSIKQWMLYNTPFYSNDLAKLAEHAGDTPEYISNHRDVLALTRVDFDKAKPIIDRLSGDGQKTSQVLAKWALYRHALDTDGVSDVDTYRDALKAVVEDKTAAPGMRDLAMDALFTEKEWSGRDDWYYSLMGDETLAELRVDGRTFTGLTTFMLFSTDEKHTEKMIDLVRSDNPVIRAAAAKNLVLRLDTNNPEVVKALLPWLEDPKWAVDNSDARGAIVRQLAEFQMPESVPGLIKMLDEKRVGPRYGANVAANSFNFNFNAANTAANAMANAAMSAANKGGYIYSNNSNSSYGPDVTTYPYRTSAISALVKQKDSRAVPVLRRILPEGEVWEQTNIVRALLTCGGFTVAEQLDALDLAATSVREEVDNEGVAYNAANAAANVYTTTDYVTGYPNRPVQKRPPTATEIRKMLADQLLQLGEISDEVARGVVDRIADLDKRDPPVATAYRRMILKWQNSAINLLLLRDLKRGVADAETIVRLLGQRKALRETQMPDIFEIRTGKPVAVGISACLLEDSPEYTAILESDDIEAKTAMFACARLIRAPLPVAKVAENLKTPNPLLQTAAERYLESEDSPEARTIVLSRHPDEAKILGARTAFDVDGGIEVVSNYLYQVYQSLGDDTLYNGWSGSSNDVEIVTFEKRLQEEVKKDDNIIGIYAYDSNYVRIYKNRVMFSWDEDDSRYRERPLTKYEFDELKAYLTSTRADELPPFNACGGAYCTAKELVMISRAGGRRIYVNGDDDNDFFNGLNKYFADLKQTPATLKYALSREIPGLEIVLASDKLHAETVWKDGDDLRVAASSTAVRKKVKEDIDETEEDTEAADYAETEVNKEAIREKRRYEGFAWYRIVSGAAEGGAAQPPGVEFIPMRDGNTIQPSDEQWKARFGNTEIRASEGGLFKLANGNLTKLRSGNYANIVVTPTGRWAFATKTDEKVGPQIVRIDLLTKKEYPLEMEDYGEPYPSAYVGSINKILIVRQANYGDEYAPDAEDDDTTPLDTDPESMILADVATGVTQALAGEFRPLDQQTFRPLQKASKPDEFWAAMPDAEKNETQLGIYDAKLFRFTTVLRIPKIKFNSMDMWVDEPGGKVYFVYRGHLLSLPLKALK